MVVAESGVRSLIFTDLFRSQACYLMDVNLNCFNTKKLRNLQLKLITRRQQHIVRFNSEII